MRVHLVDPAAFTPPYDRALAAALARAGAEVELITSSFGYGDVPEAEDVTVREAFYDPQMPYTWGLLASIPLPNADRSQDLIPIPGSPPDMSDPPKGCPFTARCTYAMQVCPTEFPEYTVFSAEKRDVRSRKEAEIAQTEAIIAHKRAYVDRFRYKASKAAQAQSRLKQIEKFEVEELADTSRRTPSFKFTPERPSGVSGWSP